MICPHLGVQMTWLKSTQCTILLSTLSVSGCDWLGTFPHEHDEHAQSDCGEEDGAATGDVSGDDPGDESGTHTDASDEDGTGHDGSTADPDGECTFSGFTEAQAAAGQIGTNADKPWFRYLAFSTDKAPGDMFVLDSFQGSPYFGPEKPGVYAFDGVNYVDCSLCFVIWYQCDEDYNCEKAFLADEGSVDITSMDGVSSVFAATFNDVVLREVRIDPESYVSTPVSGGDTWCLDDYTIEALILQWE